VGIPENQWNRLLKLEPKIKEFVPEPDFKQGEKDFDKLKDHGNSKSTGTRQEPKTDGRRNRTATKAVGADAPKTGRPKKVQTDKRKTGTAKKES